MLNNKSIPDWTPADFIQHSANLDHYERKLCGMARLGEETTDKEMYRAVDSIVKSHRAKRQQYFEHHKIEPIL